MNTQDIISNEQVSSLERIAAIVAKSGMGGFKTPEQATVAMLLALAEGIPLGRIIHEYHVINGRLSLRSECMLARFQRAGGIIKYIEHSDACVSVTASHPKGGALTVTWTLERARKAGLTSNPTWQKHPAAMLTARAIAEAVRAVYPACLTGVMTAEEAIEIQAVPVQAVSAPEAETHEVCEASVFDQLDQLFFESDHLEINGFLMRRGKISEPQTYRDLDPAYAKLILKNPERFFDAIEKHATENTSSSPALVAPNN